MKIHKILIISFFCISFFGKLFSQVIIEPDKVGIGTTTPSEKLEVNENIEINQVLMASYLHPILGNGNPYRYIRFGQPDEYYAGFMWNNSHASYGDGDDFTIFTYGNRDIVFRPQGTGNTYFHTGKVGIRTTTPSEALEVNGNIETNGALMANYLYPRLGDGSLYRYIRFGQPDEYYAGFMWNNSNTSYGDGNDFTIFTYDNRDIVFRPQGTGNTYFHTGKVGIGTTSPSTALHVNGIVTVEDKLVVYGSDFAEKFKVSNSENIDKEMLKGMVMIIDKNNVGQLTPCTKSYDKKVAGIVSGAGGISTGMVMGEPNTIADGDIAVAMTGRVYCYVDASYGAIEAGDLLTTSPTLGHAMKAKKFKKSQGAVIGKAMTELKEGKGLVLVLINLL